MSKLRGTWIVAAGTAASIALAGCGSSDPAQAFCDAYTDYSVELAQLEQAVVDGETADQLRGRARSVAAALLSAAEDAPGDTPQAFQQSMTTEMAWLENFDGNDPAALLAELAADESRQVWVNQTCPALDQKVAEQLAAD